jgi:uncharacterized protein YfdQ (DUF2303 family)
MENAEQFNFNDAVRIGKEQTVQTNYNGIPIFVVPDNMKVETLKHLVDEQLERPYTLKQTVELLTQQSFIDYYNRYCDENSTIFVNEKNCEFTAILDYHESPNDPKWCRHRAVYKCPQTKEWNSWVKSNNEKMNQEDFALFIEDNVREITEPNGAEMLEIASSLKAKNNVDFKSAVRLDNGELQFNYTENISGQAGVAGQLKIPEKIKLTISPFLKGAAYQPEARFRYRISPAGLQMWYTLIRPHVFSDDAFADMVADVGNKMKAGHIFSGCNF